MVLSPQTRTSRTVKEHLRIASMYERQLLFVWAAGDDIAAVLPEAWGKTAVIDLIDARQSRYEGALEEMVACLQQEDISVTAPLEPPLAETLGEPRNPYKGLRAFTKEDSADFFGREALVEELGQTLQHTLTSAPPGTPCPSLRPRWPLQWSLRTRPRRMVLQCPLWLWQPWASSFSL